MNERERIIEITGVDMSYIQDGKTLKVLSDVNLTVADIVKPGTTQGQVITCFGASGSGKSTLMRGIAGFNPTDTGSILIRDPKQKTLVPTSRGKVGYVFQNYAIFNHLTVREHLLLGAKKNDETSDKKLAVEQIAKRFRIENLMSKYPNQLSGGQRQRVALAQQMLIGHQIILLDEPFTGIDPPTQNEVVESLFELAQSDEYITLIIVSHDVEPALKLSDTVYFVGRKPNEQIATIRHDLTINMADRGVAWRPDLWHGLEMTKIIREVNEKFTRL